jgi:serine/threonine protein kinase
MSPEILQNKPYNNKSDVWALGCVLYEMTTLNQAFQGETMHELASKIARGRYPTINHRYSKSLRELISQMLLVDSSQRPDLGQILKKSFTKKHAIDFFTEITEPTQTEGMGEGTLVLRAAAGGPVNERIFHQNTTVLSLRKQLVVLNLIQPKKKDLKLRVDTTLGKILLTERSAVSQSASSLWLLITSCLRDHPISTATDSSLDSEERSPQENSQMSP